MSFKNRFSKIGSSATGLGFGEGATTTVGAGDGIGVVSVGGIGEATGAGVARGDAAGVNVGVILAEGAGVGEGEIVTVGSAAAPPIVVIRGKIFPDNKPPVNIRYNTTENIAPLMVWAIWWVGMAYISALLGDLWALINPVNTVFAWAASIYSRLRRGAVLARGVRYPPALAAWPAVALFDIR